MLWNDSGRGTVGLLVIFGQSASIVLVRVSIALERPEFQIPNSGIRASEFGIGSRASKKIGPFFGRGGVAFFF